MLYPSFPVTSWLTTTCVPSTNEFQLYLTRPWGIYATKHLCLSSLYLAPTRLCSSTQMKMKHVLWMEMGWISMLERWVSSATNWGASVEKMGSEAGQKVEDYVDRIQIRLDVYIHKVVSPFYHCIYLWLTIFCPAQSFPHTMPSPMIIITTMCPSHLPEILGVTCALHDEQLVRLRWVPFITFCKYYKQGLYFMGLHISSSRVIFFFFTFSWLLITLSVVRCQQ